MLDSLRGSRGLEGLAEGVVTIDVLSRFRDEWIHFELARWWRAELSGDSEWPTWMESGARRRPMNAE